MCDGMQTSSRHGSDVTDKEGMVNQQAREPSYQPHPPQVSKGALSQESHSTGCGTQVQVFTVAPSPHSSVSLVGSSHPIKVLPCFQKVAQPSREGRGHTLITTGLNSKPCYLPSSVAMASLSGEQVC